MKRTEQPLLPSYTIEQIDLMAKTWDHASFSMACDARVRQIERHSKLTFIELGYLCLRVEQMELWKIMYDSEKFRSFGAWISDAAPSSRSTAYAAMGEVRKAIEDKLPLDEANKLPRCNLKTVNRLSTKLKHDPEILKAAEVLPEQDFKRKINKEHPDQKIEDDSPMRLKPSRSQRKVIDTAIEAAMRLNGMMSREEALEAIAEDYLLSHQAELEEITA